MRLDLISCEGTQDGLRFGDFRLDGRTRHFLWDKIAGKVTVMHHVHTDAKVVNDPALEAGVLAMLNRDLAERGRMANVPPTHDG